MIVFLISILLLATNILFVNYSDNKRRYSIYSSRISLLLIVIYTISYMFYLADDPNAKDIFGVYNISETKSRPKTEKQIAYEKELEASEIIEPKNQENKISIPSYILQSALVQLIITILFSYIGLSIIKKEKNYYRNMMFIHIPLFLFCLFWFIEN